MACKVTIYVITLYNFHNLNGDAEEGAKRATAHDPIVTFDIRYEVDSKLFEFLFATRHVEASKWLARMLLTIDF